MATPIGPKNLLATPVNVVVKAAMDQLDAPEKANEYNASAPNALNAQEPTSLHDNLAPSAIKTPFSIGISGEKLALKIKSASSISFKLFFLAKLRPYSFKGAENEIIKSFRSLQKWRIKEA
jgi:hypothetical protein